MKLKQTPMPDAPPLKSSKPLKWSSQQIERMKRNVMADIREDTFRKYWNVLAGHTGPATNRTFIGSSNRLTTLISETSRGLLLGEDQRNPRMANRMTVALQYILMRRN